MSVGTPARIGHLLPTRDRPRRSPGQLLYGLYLFVLFGGLYGGLLVHAIVTTATPPLTPEQLLVLGGVAAGLPAAGALAGVRFGRWAGPVPLTRPEAALLLPTPLDRRQLLLPRLAWSAAATTLAGSVLGLAAVVLLALAATVGAAGWWLVPALGGVTGALAAGSAGLAQAWPLTARRHRVVAGGLALLAVLPLLMAGVGRPSTPWWDAGLVHLARSLLGLAPAAPASGSLGGLAVATGVVVAASAVALPRAHDEELVTRAGLHAGALAALRLGDLRAVTTLRNPTARRRAITAPPTPRRATGAVTWRHLTGLRAHPGPLLRAVLGWGVATWLVAATATSVSLAGIVFRVLVAAAVLVVALAPLLEPLRREHDEPLAAELLPFGFATLARLHLRTAIGLAVVTGLVAVPAAALLLGAPLTWALAVVPGAAVTAVVAVADRVRQPENLAEVMASMPLGATPEVLGVALAARLVLPLVAMLPIAVPVAAGLAAAVLGVPLLPVLLLAGGLGVLLLGLRAGGLLLWLSEYEGQLLDADLLEPGSTIPIAWRRLQAWWDRRHR